jgi:hypothetical protein
MTWIIIIIPAVTQQATRLCARLDGNVILHPPITVEHRAARSNVNQARQIITCQETAGSKEVLDGVAWRAKKY